MKNLLLFFLILIAKVSFTQQQEKDLKYYYYYLDQDKNFVSYLNARREFDAKKADFKLPVSKEASKELEENEQQIFKTEKTYAAFLSKYNMINAGEYAELWFKQMNTLKTFLRKNPEFYSLSSSERQSIIDKWYYSTKISTK